MDGFPYAEARLWGAKTGRPLSPSFRHRENISGLAFSPDSKLVAFASSDGTVDVVATAIGGALYPPLVCAEPVPTGSGSVVFTDARTLLAATARRVTAMAAAPANAVA